MNHSPETQGKIEKLQSFEQTMQGLVGQKQVQQSQLVEVESALAELEKATKAYKIVGGIMVEATPASLKEELSQKKDMLDLRMASFEKQEKQLREKIKSTQAEIVQGMQKK